MSDHSFVLGRDDVGTIAEDRDPAYKSGPLRYYLTECCGASAKGMADYVGCRACYTEIDPALGGTPGLDCRLIDGAWTFIQVPMPMLEVYGDGLPYADWKARYLGVTA